VAAHDKLVAVDLLLLLLLLLLLGLGLGLSAVGLRGHHRADGLGDARA